MNGQREVSVISGCLAMLMSYSNTIQIFELYLLMSGGLINWLLYLGREPVDLWYGNTVGDYDRVGSERTHIIEEMLLSGKFKW